MNNCIALVVLGISMTVRLTAQVSPSEKLAAALTELVGKDNYSWTTKVRNGLGPTQGSINKDGQMYVVTSLPGARGTREAAISAGKSAERFGSKWRVTTNLGAQREIGGLLRSPYDPAVQAADLLSKVKELKSREPGIYFGALTDKGAESLIGTLGWEITKSPAAQGTATFWVKEGTLIKFEYHVVSLPDRHEITRTTEIKDIGTTKVEIPEEAEEVLKK